jgi:hypothetical protein
MYKTLKRHHGSPLPPSADTVTAALRAKSELRIMTAVKWKVQVNLVEKGCRLPSKHLEVGKASARQSRTYRLLCSTSAQAMRQRNRAMPAPKNNAER